jgi:hypothetical protein
MSDFKTDLGYYRGFPKAGGKTMGFWKRFSVHYFIHYMKKSYTGSAPGRSAVFFETPFFPAYPVRSAE